MVWHKRPAGCPWRAAAGDGHIGRRVSARARIGRTRFRGPGYADQEKQDSKLAMTMDTVKQAMENMEYVRRLLGQKQPGFAAALELATSQLESKLCEPVVRRRIAAMSAVPPRCAAR